ncbi:translation initiation factor eIF2B catalytic subunit epsilon NDAI_0C04810 [Naumovozyma dairenensis CBS 421]|uniref:Translation initiation factor eIF2B subunit epsilon n=1 Tax=Naumovozyma dairenensis (strain ATCC 10597 / BCRC 20456 / CBS 421 / NBRC 0211 / NRRL Y-12639) TaxID=1071378 RepID=G0W8M9_NAUDC|nr:hypothetical protein NDAI_0C04810 [Naumovozyma dairenensis CBS 421]CCD24140.1 hypothetical protein NDAI_0C04810 [Naumovozyma dairenensis CBS 421]
MAGKKNKSNHKNASALNGRKSDVDVDDRLQAIILTDSYETKFMPLTATKPRCLLPLANVPLIEYTLEFLAKSGVDEVYLICSSHASQIDEYIANSKWNLPWSPFKVSTVMSPEARSVGDVMRDLDNRGTITGDFVLISGDVVTNVDFSKMFEFHKKMRSKDKDHISTMCLSRANQFHRTRSLEPACFVLDKDTSRCIYYEDLPTVGSNKKSCLDIDPELLENVDDFVLRNDLIDCRIDICTPHVPPIFQENFDYQTLRSDFVKGVISSDLLGKHIYAYITDEYAVRVESWQTYDTISQDFIGRWCYPLVLDSNMQEDQTYSYDSRHIYKEKDVVLAQSCKIGRNTAIGSGTKIGEATVIENCIIGRNCQIGENIKLSNSFIWDNSVINNNCTIEHSIIATGSEIGQNVTINDGCIIGFDVIIDSDMNIPKGTKISSTPVKYISGGLFDSNLSEDDESDYSDKIEDTEAIKATGLVGYNGVGFVYESDVSDDEDDMSETLKLSNTLAYQMEELCLSDESISSRTKRVKKKRTMSTNSMYTDFEGNDSEEEEEDFEKEGFATIERAIENNHDLDTAMLELNTLRMSMDVTYHEVRTVTVLAILQRVYHFIATQTLGAKEAVQKVFGQWGLLFKRQTFDTEEYIDLMNILLDKVVDQHFEKPDLVLFGALNSLYDNDVLEEDVIYKWWDEVSDDPRYEEAKRLTARWIEWLKTADEESSSEDEDDD